MSGGPAGRVFGARHQLPVHSPIPLPALLRSARDRGDSVATLRSRLLRHYDAEEAVPCGSGTAALQLAIRHALARTGTRDVALPGFCCYDVASAAVGAEAGIALYDLDPATLSPDPDSLEGLLRAGLRVVVVAHLYGMPVDWDALDALARSHGAVLVEDAAQGHGGWWRGRPLGSLGGLGVLSFGRGKGWTGGGGGALLLRDGWENAPAPAAAGAGWKVLGASLAQWLLGRPSIYGVPSALPWLALGETRYHPPSPPSDLPRRAAALALRTRAASDAEARARRSAAAALREALEAVPGARPIDPVPGAEPGYLRFPVRVPGALGAFPSPAAALRLGIGRSYPTTLAALPAVRERSVGPGSALPGAEALVRDLVTLPTHSLVLSRERSAALALLGHLPPAWDAVPAGSRCGTVAP